MAHISDQSKKKLLLTKSLEIYRYLDTSSKTLSFERMSKIKKIEDIILAVDEI
jgi:hypothetical protein